MQSIMIDKRFLDIAPQMVLGCIEAQVVVEESSDGLKEWLEGLSQNIQDQYNLSDLVELPSVKATRQVYKALGKSPSRYRASSEALLRRILQGKGLYHINQIIDINNYISIKSGHPVGSYNLDAIQGEIELSVPEEGASYEGIGKGSINISSLPSLRDKQGFFGSPTSDSIRSLVGNDTQNILMCIYAFSGSEKLEDYMQEACDLLEKYGYAKNIQTRIIRV